MRVEALEELLLDSREALLAGDMAAIEALTLALESELRLAEAANLPPKPWLDYLRALALQNDQLLMAAREGLAAARQRLLPQGEPLSTYDAKGQRAKIKDHPKQPPQRR